MPIAYEVWLKSLTVFKTGDAGKREISVLASIFKPRPGLTTISSGRTVAIPPAKAIDLATYLTKEGEDPRTALLFYDVVAPASPITIQVLTKFSKGGLGDVLVKILGGLAGAALSGPLGIVAGVFLDSAVDQLTDHDPDIKSLGRAEINLPVIQPGTSQDLVFTLLAPEGVVLAPRKVGPPAAFGQDNTVTPAIVLNEEDQNGSVTLTIKATLV